MIEQRKIGALAAVICAGTYVFGFALLVTVLAPSGSGSGDIDPAQFVAFAAENPGLMTVWNLTIYVVNGLALAGLATAVSARFRAYLPGMSQAIFAIGLLWATLVTGAGMVANVGLDAVLARHSADPQSAIAMWEVFHTIELGLGGGNEIAGGVWALLVGIAALTSKRLPRGFGLLSLSVGLAGLATLLPMLGEVPGAIFGLGYIVWFIWVAIVLVRSN